MKKNNNAARTIYFLICICFLITNCSGRADQEIHYLHNGFIGRVHIFFNIPKGINEDSNNQRIYNIPSSGLFISSLNPNDGFLKDGERSFFYENNIKIPYISEISDAALKKYHDSICIFSLIVGKSDNTPYLSYCIDTLKNSSKYYELDFNNEHSIVDSIKNTNR